MQTLNCPTDRHSQNKADQFSQHSVEEKKQKMIRVFYFLLSIIHNVIYTFEYFLVYVSFLYINMF